MLEVDLHTHSLFSLCGIHTTVEMLTRGKELGLKAMAITDHGKALKGRLNNVFFERLKEPVPGIKLLKGMECNILDENGNNDCMLENLKYMDIVLIGFHKDFVKSQAKEKNTQVLINVMENFKYIDIITHPHDACYEFDFYRLAESAKKNDVALELNNSKIMLERVSAELTEKMLLACKDVECQIAVNSDAHGLNEIGLDKHVRPLLEKIGFPEKLIINRDYDVAMEYINRKKKMKNI